MTKTNFCIALLLSSTAAFSSELGWLDFSDIPQTREHLMEDAVVVAKACDKNESYTKIKNFAAIEYVVKACAVSNKFPIDSREKQLCDYLSQYKSYNRKLLCARRAVGQKYSEEDLAPKYKQYLATGPKCNESHICFNNFLDDFSWPCFKSGTLY